MTPVDVSKDDEPGKAARVQQLSRALLFALVSAIPDQPYPIPVPVAVAVAELLDAHGVRQTDERGAVELPSWITQRVQEETQRAEVVSEPDVHAPQPNPLVRKAPPCPAKIPKKLLGVVVR